MYDASHPESAITKTSNERVMKTAKKCPGKDCPHWIEKDGGCDHMYCSHCSSAWSWSSVEYEGSRKAARRS